MSDFNTENNSIENENVTDLPVDEVTTPSINEEENLTQSLPGSITEDDSFSPLQDMKERLKRKDDYVYENHTERLDTERDLKLKDEQAIKEAEKRSLKTKENTEKKGRFFSILNKAGQKLDIHHVHKTVQQTIPYRNIYKNGIIEVEEGFFSKSYLLSDINFRIAPSEEQESIFGAYGDLLNSFGHECYISITINNKNMDAKKFAKDTLIQFQGDELDEYRSEINQMLRERMKEGKNNLVHEKYLTIGMYSPNIEEATIEFSRIDGNVSLYMKKISPEVECEPLTIEQRLAIMYDVYNLDNDYTFGLSKIDDGVNVKTFDLRDLNRSGLTSKDIIGPSSFLFEKDYFMMGDTYGQSMYIQGYPTYLKTDLLPDITDLAANMLCTVHFTSLRQDKAITMIKNRMTAIDSAVVDAQKKASQSGYSAELISPELQKQQEEAKKLLADVTSRNQKLFFATVVITHFANSKDVLDKNKKSLETILNRHLCAIKPLSYQQEYGLSSSFPLGKNKIKDARLNTTETASVFIPFSAQEWHQKKGFYYGLNTVSRNMIIYNRSNGVNYNSVILGVPGSGKSFSSKREIANIILSTNDDVCIIDPEREYVVLCKMLGGEVFKISTGSNLRLNPFDLDIDDAEDGQDPIAPKADFIRSLCDVIIGGSYGLTPTQVSIIDRCVRKIYGPYISEMSRRRAKNKHDTIDRSICPTLKDFYECLLEQDEAEGQEIALALEIYISGSLNNFAGHTNVNVQNRLVVFDIKDIGSGMMELGLQICLNHIWTVMINNKRKHKLTYMYIDELHLFAKHESSAAYIKNIYKRARKWGGCPCGMTQEVGDLLQSETCASVITTSNFVMLFRQSPIDRMRLTGMFNLSDEEQDYITNANPGQGLLISNGKSKIPFTDAFPSDTKLYAAMTTKADDENSLYSEV